ncbi:hypothetical protein JVT61DRAFT_10335 [Boletus reticuloceps]|uniref:Uncharacterized protein n=1 Tax=Boletus reticuloceps TaxID=495285 RepID=A0A8I3AEV5_9AGAM|nr:hypothetical protein JVT61DRAFT_10335 [Boletus reticuloceps]
MTPLGFVRRCMKAMSRIARNMPSHPTVTWNANHTKIAIQNHTIDLSQYVQ